MDSKIQDTTVILAVEFEHCFELKESPFSCK